MVLSDKVLRIKGVVQFHNHAERYYYQYVPGSNSLTPVNDEAPDENFLVFIGEDIENSAQSLLTLISSQQKITTQTKEV
jgi:G3E family GTPase